MEILRLTSDHDCSAEDLVQILQADPALTGRILWAANHLSCNWSEPAVTVAQAAVRLGNRAVRNLALGFSLISTLQRGACAGFDYDRFWADSVVRALVCEQLSHLLRCGVASDVFVVGLLGRIGALALATVHPESYSQIVTDAGQGLSAAVLERERAEYGIDQVGISMAMMREWRLPEETCRAVGASFHLSATAESEHKPGVGEVVWCAARISWAFASGKDRPVEMDAVQTVLKRFNRWDFDRLHALWDTTRELWPEWADLLGLRVEEVPRFLSVAEVSSASAAGEAAPAQATSSGAAPSAGGDEDEGLHILVVDDDPMSLRLLTLRLEKAGYRVSSAREGREALRMALELNPQLIIADWMMPEMNGIELCTALRRTDAGRQMYIILLTSKSEEHQVVEAFDSGVDDYVVKPWRSRLLLARVRAGKRVIDLQRQVEEDKRVMQKQVAELGVLARKLRQASLTDALTELPNRRCAMNDLAEEWARALANRDPLSLIMVDIDHFKRFNDEHGHDIGDFVLREVARGLDSSIGDPVRVYRIGGEEFLVIAPGLDGALCAGVAERLRVAIADTTLQSGGFSGAVTISLGVAERDATMEDREVLLKAADDALYAAKARGRNCVALATPPVHSAS